MIVPHLVSVIVPVHNRPTLIRTAVESALTQSWTSLEVIVVDDGSDDETPRSVAALVAEHPTRVQSVRRDPPGGPGVAREAGRQLARGEFIQYLDSDDTLAPDKLRRQVEGFRARPDCEIAYGLDEARHRRPDGSAYVVPHDVPVIGRLFPTLFAERPWYTFNPLYRRSIVDRVGPWRALWFSEDIEYDSRMAAAGARLCFVETPTGTLSRTGDDHLSKGAASRRALVGWATARAEILASARRCGVSLTGSEFETFTRSMLHVSRQCGEAGLRALSERLFELACSVATDPGAPALQAYRAVARAFGWRAAGVLARSLDRARDLARGLRP